MDTPRDTPDTVTARPHRVVVAAWISAVAVVVLFSLVGLGLHGQTEGGGAFARGDQAAMVGLGLLMAGGILLFTRPRVWADRRGLRVRNVMGSYDVPWELVRAVRFNDNSPWASLDLQDDDTIALMAIQRSDHTTSLTAVRELRALLAQHRSGAAAVDGESGPAAS
ncbi:MAG TPA: PH domain-containing protein [Mycobacteriales bacterium]